MGIIEEKRGCLPSSQDGLPENEQRRRERDSENHVQKSPVQHKSVERHPRARVLQVRHQRLPLLKRLQVVRQFFVERADFSVRPFQVFRGLASVVKQRMRGAIHLHGVA